MLFSLIQTLVCVLLVNGGLYALHLTGSSSSSSSSNQNGSPSSLGGTSGNGGSSSGHSAASQQSLRNPPFNPFQSTSNSRLNEELADLAQLERERLMVMGLAKQTAEESGYHGRPIITGRIKMHPAEEIDPDYSTWLTQQAHNVMFGNVIKQPVPSVLNDENAGEDYDAARGGGDGGGGGGGSVGGSYAAPRRPSKYDYGRVVQPAEREFENPHTLDLDDFMELESVAADEEEMFPDLDGYAYIDELIGGGGGDENKERVQHQQTHHQNVPQFPGFRQQATHHTNPYNSHIYQNPESHLEAIVPESLQELFEKETEHRLQMQQREKQQQQQQQQQQQLQHQQRDVNQQMDQQQQQQQQLQFNPKYRNNIRLQQKWQRKRSQMQQQQQQQHPQMTLPRNIFGQKNKQQQQQHYFKTQSTNKLSLANSEATATSKITNKHLGDKPLSQQQQQKQQQQLNDNHGETDKNFDVKKTDKLSFATSSSSSSSPSASSVSAIGEQQKPDQILNPNHKRSGVAGSSSGLPSSQGMGAGAAVSPHSLASQLMLRTARGQRQYDVPQIECPTAMDGMERFACPTPDVKGRFRCIDDHVLCDGFIDCPEGEDEDRRSCMFYKTTKAHLDVLADALLRWARGR